jgi:hypothetical protein
MGTGTSEYRLVLRGRQGSLYDLDAGPYASPAWTFGVEVDQELPRIAAGVRVTIADPITSGSRPTIFANGTELRPHTPLRSGRQSPMYAERPCVVHPEAVDWDDSWQWAVLSTWSIDEWRDRVRAAGRWRPWRFLALATWSIVLVLWVREVVVGHAPPWLLAFVPFLIYVIWIRVGEVRKTWGARQTFAALERAGDARGSHPRGMWMALRWTVGHGDGALAVADLFEDAQAATPVASVGVCNLTPRFQVGGRTQVDVFGDPHDAAVLVRGSTTLWPVDHRYISGYDNVDRPSTLDRRRAAEQADRGPAG